MTRSIAADLDRRGYIVYITVSSAEEEHLIRAENRPDIRPLWLDLTTVSRMLLFSQVNSRILTSAAPVIAIGDTLFLE